MSLTATPPPTLRLVSDGDTFSIDGDGTLYTDSNLLFEIVSESLQPLLTCLVRRSDTKEGLVQVRYTALGFDDALRSALSLVVSQPGTSHLLS